MFLSARKERDELKDFMVSSMQSACAGMSGLGLGGFACKKCNYMCRREVWRCRRK